MPDTDSPRNCCPGEPSSKAAADRSSRAAIGRLIVAADELEHLAWAAEQLALHNPDPLVNDKELPARVASLCRVSGRVARELSDGLEPLFFAEK